MPRKSKGRLSGHNDWSKPELAYAELLHKDIFENGDYFKLTSIDLKHRPVANGRKRGKKKRLRKIQCERSNSSCSFEDEGYVEEDSRQPYLKMFHVPVREYLDQLDRFVKTFSSLEIVWKDIGSAKTITKEIEPFFNPCNPLEIRSHDRNFHSEVKWSVQDIYGDS